MGGGWAAVEDWLRGCDCRADSVLLNPVKWLFQGRGSRSRTAALIRCCQWGKPWHRGGRIFPVSLVGGDKPGYSGPQPGKFRNIGFTSRLLRDRLGKSCSEKFGGGPKRSGAGWDLLREKLSSIETNNSEAAPMSIGARSVFGRQKLPRFGNFGRKSSKQLLSRNKPNTREGLGPPGAENVSRKKLVPAGAPVGTKKLKALPPDGSQSLLCYQKLNPRKEADLELLTS